MKNTLPKAEKKIQIKASHTVSDAKKIDKIAKSQGLTRSGAVALIVKKSLAAPVDYRA